MSAPLWNKQTALIQIGGDEALLAEIKELFISEASRCIEQLRNAGQSPRYGAAAAEAAHALKGMSMHFCAQTIIELAGQVERRGRAGLLKPNDDLVIQLADWAEELVECLKTDS